jgi:uncharacterized membrane protein YqgA involved in biofilm formation
LVHENDGKSIFKAVKRFDVMTQSFIALMVPKVQEHMALVSLVSTGLTGYVSHLATRWAMGGFREPMGDVINACMVLYGGLLSMLNEQAANGTEPWAKKTTTSKPKG